MALAETVFPADDPRHVRSDDAHVVEYLDDLLAAVEPRERAMMRALLALFDLQQAAATPLRPTLFSWARPEDRAKSLDGWDKSRLYPRRAAFQAIRSLLLWAYVDNPDVERSIGIERGTTVVDRLRAAGWKVGDPVAPPEHLPPGVEP